MYKSPLDNFNDFYNQVFEKETASKQNNSKVEKSYFEYKNNQVYLRIKHDAINHGDKKHRLSAEEWKNVLENILNIENAAISNKQYSNDNVALIKVATPNGKYGVSIQFANGTNQISTIFKSTDKGIDSWIKKGSANSSTSEPLTSRDNSHTVAVVGQNPNDIIAYIKEQLNPSEQTKILYQSAATAGAETSAEISDAQKEWQEKGTDSKYFKKWFGDSKVVDENGQPLVVYHGSPSHDITTFDSDKTLYGEISKGFNFFTNKKSAYQNSADDYANFAGTNGYRRNGKVYETYLKIQKPLHIKYTSNAMSLYNGDKRYSTPVEYYDTNYKEIKEKYNNGDYDGIIIENTDKNNDDSIIYLVPNSEQIKSVNNRGTFDESNPNIYFQSEIIEPVPESENNNYKNFVQKVFDKKLTTKDKSRPYIIGKTPDKLKEAGISNNDISIGYKVIEKAFGEKNDDHKLNKDTLEKVYEALYSPIAIIKAETNKNETNNNRYSVILDLKNNGDYVLVGIDSDKRIDKNVVNDIRSVHSRKSFFPLIEKAFNENRIRKIKKSKIKDLLLTNQSDSISDGVTSLINSISQKYEKTNVFYQSAYHGSPARFDKFDLDYIGSGEGAQVHGYGTYVAKDKNIADERYRKTLSDTIGIGTEILVDNVTYKKIATNTYKKKENIYDSVDDYLNEALNFIETQGSKKKALKYVQEQIDNHKDAGYFDDAVYYIRIKDALNEIIKAKITKYADDYGQLYEVEIPEDDEMLDEDLPFSEQPQKVQENLKKLWEEKLKRKVYTDKKSLLSEFKEKYDSETYDIVEKLLNKGLENLSRSEKNAIPNSDLSFDDLHKLDYFNLSGKDIYYNIINNVFERDDKFDKDTSLLLNEYGIKGIKYNGRIDGQCYVIFNPENIDITRTFYQEGISPKTSQKAKEVVSALK